MNRGRLAPEVPLHPKSIVQLALVFALALALPACQRDCPCECGPEPTQGGESAPHGHEHDHGHDHDHEDDEDFLEAIRRELSEEDRALLPLLGEETRAPIPLSVRRPRMGPATAPITLVLFSDMQCPFCARVMPTLERLVAAYPGEIRLYWAHLPLPMHPQADVAARASVAVFEEAGHEAFYRFLTELSADLRDFSDDRILALAQAAGASAEGVTRAIEDYEHDEAVGYDKRVAQALGIRGTPFTLVNGRPVSGAQPFEAFAEIVEEERRVAAALRGAGVPGEKIYETLVRLTFGPAAAAEAEAPSD